jgi:MFS family permease
VTTKPRTRPLPWVTRDAWLMISARAMRTFAQTSISVFFAIYLTEIGYTVAETGLLVTIGSAGSAFFAFIIVFIGDSFGRRRLLVAFTLLTGATGVGFALSDQYLLLAITTFFVGSLAISGSGPRGPIQPLETASLPDTTSSEHRTDLFALSGIVERGARVLGSLAAALPAVFVVVLGITEIQGFKVMFVGYAVVMVASAGLYWMLSPAIDRPLEHHRFTNPFKLPSRRTIFTMAAIASVDSFATRFVFFSLVALWFKTKFGFELADVSYLLASATILSAFSLWVAARLASRIGLLNTIVFTHIPAVVFTFALPFAPWAWLAVLMFLGRGFFSQMDTAPKNSYTMAIVNRDERAAMAGVNNLTQATVGTAVPTLATVLWESVSISAPFIAAGVLKSVYLTWMYFTFRNVRPPEEIERRERKQRAREAAKQED